MIDFNKLNLDILKSSKTKEDIMIFAEKSMEIVSLASVVQKYSKECLEEINKFPIPSDEISKLKIIIENIYDLIKDYDAEKISNILKE